MIGEKLPKEGTVMSLNLSQLIAAKDKSAGYSSTNTSTFQSCVILALMPGRGRLRHEVGIALIDLFYPHLILCQINDSHVYPNTLAKINIYQPEEIIVPEVHTNEPRADKCLYEAIVRKFEGVNVTTIPRTHFNPSIGWDLLKIHCTDESSLVLEVLRQKELATSAAAGLLRYIVYIQGISYAPKTVKIEFQSCNDSVVISIESVEALEILNSHEAALPNRNLYNLIDKCVTAVGKKLLRASILQPLYNVNRINDRLQCVTELISNPSFLQILQNLERNKCNEVKAFISEIIQVDAIPAKGFTSANMQRCFAIKPKVSELLDVIRQAYCELIDSMIQYVEDLSIKYGLQLTLGCSAEAGYHILTSPSEKLDRVLSNSTGSSSDRLLLLIKRKRARLLTTERLLVDSQKCGEICEEIHIMSNVLIENLISKIRNYIGYFFQLCSDISELDLMVSLALVSRREGFIRPTFGHKLCLIDSFHPIRLLFDSENCTPNNVIASVPYNFHVISGPNFGGKTTYLQQILLIQLLAQIGCYIPAQRAEIRISDRLFFYSSVHVDAGRSMSGFATEVTFRVCVYVHPQSLPK
ncbi:hypothetical protein QAD02_022181 [Eretmocerus hayati]|uniref:Uncharacterized protein n=1 Tax=Eretmocerus hayati TaxID=131215 RepID=A0ACC2PSK0_9HYME|nr:hypothetical protein QAD02_022181 [Eretmocerus hayati]